MVEPGEQFARALRDAEERLRATGLSGRSAFLALTRHLCARLGISENLWPEGPDATPAAALHEIPLAADLDLFGLAYERFFSDLFKGQKGQYFTPRPLVELMADLANIGARDRVLDPTCGSGGFLIAAMDRGADVEGVDVDPDLVTLARLNLALRGGNPRAIQQQELFGSPVEGRYDAILANPPFSVSITDAKILREYELAQGRNRATSDSLFLEAAWRRLAPNGRLCTVLPYSVLVNQSAGSLREWIDSKFVRRAVVGLPEGVFRPFGGTATRACVLLLQKRPAQIGKQLVAEVAQPGFDPSRKEYRRQEPDELAALRLFLNGQPYERGVWVDTGGSWAPGDHLGQGTLGTGVDTVRFGSLAHAALERCDPSNEPGALYTEIDLADLDKTTGEVANARARQGSEFPKGQSKVQFQVGDILFGRMRPYLNNVGMASRPRKALPDDLVGSSEWVPFRATKQPHFALLALRSIFAREQLRTTGGQTRPRARASDLPKLELPDPGPDLRRQLDKTLRGLHEERLKLRHAMHEVEELYELFGRGEISAEELASRLEALTPR